MDLWYALKAWVAKAALASRSSARKPVRVAISPQSAFVAAADRPASAAQLTGLNLAIQRIQLGRRLCCISAEERKVSGSVTMVTIPISVSRCLVRTATPFESE